MGLTNGMMVMVPKVNAVVKKHCNPVVRQAARFKFRRERQTKHRQRRRTVVDPVAPDSWPFSVAWNRR